MARASEIRKNHLEGKYREVRKTFKEKKKNDVDSLKIKERYDRRKILMFFSFSFFLIFTNNRRDHEFHFYQFIIKIELANSI